MFGQPEMKNIIGLPPTSSMNRGWPSWPRSAPVDCDQAICSLPTLSVLMSLSGLWRVSLLSRPGAGQVLGSFARFSISSLAMPGPARPIKAAIIPPARRMAPFLVMCMRFLLIYAFLAPPEEPKRARVHSSGDHAVPGFASALFQRLHPQSHARRLRLEKLRSDSQKLRGLLQIRATQVVRRYNIRSQIQPEIGDEFPRAAAIFPFHDLLKQPLLCAGEMHANLRCVGARKKAVRCRENLNEGQRLSRHPTAERGTAKIGETRNTASGSFPESAGKLVLLVLPLFPERQLMPMASSFSARPAAHHNCVSASSSAVSGE